MTGERPLSRGLKEEEGQALWPPIRERLPAGVEPAGEGLGREASQVETRTWDFM